MEWGQVKNFIWLWTLPAAVFLFLLSYWRKRAQLERFGDLLLVGRLVASLDPWTRFTKRALVLLTLLFMVIALAQPHFRKKETLVERRGIDVMIAVDVSNSMLAKDIAPTRLEKAKLELSGLIDKLKGNRIGIIAFAGEAVIQCPLTLDRSAVKLFLSTMSPNLISFQGTDIGSALSAALQAFQDKDKDSKAVILLTDGEDHNKETPAIIKKAKAAGVRVFTIGVGTAEGGTVPDEFGRGIKKDRAGKVVLSKLGETLLKQIARETGGVYFRSEKGDLEADKIRKQIDLISTKGFKSDWSVEYEENFRFFLILAFILLLLEMILSEGKRTESAALKVVLIFFLILPLCGFKFVSELQNEKANALYKKGQVAKAKTEYARALKTDPTSSKISYNLGNALFKEGAFKDSQATYQKASGGKEPEPAFKAKAFYNLGNSYYRLKDLPNAAEAYKRSLRLNPKDEDAKYNLELVLKQLEKEKKEDPKKDDKKKEDEKKDQPQKNDPKNDKQDGGGSQGSEGDKPKDPKGGKEDKPDDQKGGGQGSSGEKEKEEKSSPQDGQESGGKKEPGDEEEGRGKPEKGEGQEQKEEERKDAEEPGEEKGGLGEEGSEEKKEEKGQGGLAGQESQEEPKSDAQIRAEQILGALENQERQVLKFQNSQDGPRGRVRRVSEQDW